ncbi:MAG: hypothetical protein R3293_26960 [Candidatus Promineifilaceae bacterium]|nr:hypothetical protein [Candidatus Promineifilaceae bacterium]
MVNDWQSALEKLGSPGPVPADEASLLWDEYKYRHDLIWQHLIRSTVALVALVTVRFINEFRDLPLLTAFAFLAALVYWGITFLVIDRELHLYLQVKAWHRYRQCCRFGLHKQDQAGCDQPDFSNGNRGWITIYFASGFPRRVGLYLLFLFLGILFMAPVCELVYFFNWLHLPLSSASCLAA